MSPSLFARFLKRWWPVWASMLLATATFSVAVSTYPTPPVISDAVGYASTAHTLVTKHLYAYANASGQPDALVMPGYPLFVSAFYISPGADTMHQVVRDRHPWLLGSQLLLAVLTVGLVAAAGMAIGKRSLGALAGFMAALYLPLAWSSSVILTESLAVFLVTLQLLLALRLLRDPEPHSGSFAALGVVTGLVTIVRPVYLPWLLVPLALFALSRKASPRSTVKLVGICLLGLLAVLAPWTIRNAVVFNRFIPLTAEWEGKRLSMARAILDSDDPQRSSDEQAASAAAIAHGEDGDAAALRVRLRRQIASDPVGLIARRLSFSWTSLHTPHAAPVDQFLMQRDSPEAASVAGGVAFQPPPAQLTRAFRWSIDSTVIYQQVLVWLALIGLPFVWRRPRLLLVWSFVFYSVALYTAILFQPRYFFPTMPAVILLAAVTIAGIAGLLRRLVRRNAPESTTDTASI
ncbi:MAG: hypothetical protein HGB10_03660 [Coriobacteriia bacterium]|nr:hypothetical protein [Coriobacteriia bacterium]